jgi:hypothetical protein
VSDVAQETDGALYVFDNLNGGDKVKRRRSKLRGKVRLVKIQGEVRRISFEAPEIAVHSDHVATQRL